MKVTGFLKYRCFSAIFLTALLVVIQSCSGPGMLKIPPPVPSDTDPVPMPETREFHVYADMFEKQVMVQLREALDFSRQLRNLTGTRKEARNVDAFGQVPNSSWFTNRNGLKRMSLEEIARGPDSGTGPATTGKWVITRAKAEGVTPGFSIRDGRGDNYLIKFDPSGYPELTSGAEVVSTKLFYAMGYHTPENYIVYFHPDSLELGENVKFTDHEGIKRSMTEKDLEELLSRIEKEPDGMIRALASKYLDGKPVGPFSYIGIRKDDFNDVIPHQDRRELRGLRIFTAWLNHFDTKDGNTLDMYIGEDGEGYVKHHLIDFGATLGSASHGPNELWRGYQYDTDPEVIIDNILSLGLLVRPWEKQEGVIYPSAGIFNAALFDPMEYKPQIPNPAFQCMTLRDGYWAAGIVMSFTDEQIKTAMKQGKYSDPAAEEFLFRTILARRDKIGRYFFSRMNPLDDFHLSEDSSGFQMLNFQDLAIESALESPEGTSYRCGFKELPENRLSLKQVMLEHAEVLSLKNLQQEYFSKTGNVSEGEEKQVLISIQTRRSSSAKWSNTTWIYLKPLPETTSFELLGIYRED